VLGQRAARLPLVRASVDALPFAVGTFPSLVATFPTDYIGRPQAIAEFYRVLAADGVLVSVPAAQITGLAPTDRFADWLFRVTGQAASATTRGNPWSPLLGRYEAAGFQARIELVRLPRSVVTVVIAEKV
jgi:ubiquinone/menaquinone biosynthesis C-methylase UbiE